jgi:hypothetical protein
MAAIVAREPGKSASVVNSQNVAFVDADYRRKTVTVYFAPSPANVLSKTWLFDSREGVDRMLDTCAAAFDADAGIGSND